MKRTKKTLALLLTLAMVLTLFAGVAQASASVAITSTFATVTADGTRTPGRIEIDTDVERVVDAGSSTTVSITLPIDVEWVTTTAVAGVVITDPAAAIPTTTISGFSFSQSDRTIEFTVTSTVNINEIRFRGVDINIPSGFSGDLNAEVIVTSTSVPSWGQRATVRIANVVSAGTVSTVSQATNILRGASNQLAGVVEIREAVANSLTTGEIRLTLPDGVTWNTAPTITVVPAGPVVTSTWPAIEAGRRVVLPLDSADVAPTVIQSITISNIRLNVSMDVPDGPINIAIANHIAGTDVGVTSATLAVATVGVGAVTVSRHRDLPSTWNLGRLNREIGIIRLAETLAGSLTPNRSVTLTLPVGYTWHTPPVDNSNGPFATSPIMSDGGRTLTYWTITNATGTRTDFDLENGRINARIDATPGDVVVTVGGNAGASGTAVVAVSRRPVTVTVVSTPNVRADSLNQLVGNIVITETAAGALRTGDLEIVFPAGVSSVGATVSVSDVVGTEPTVRVTDTGGVLNLEVSAATVPINPATVTISGIRINAQLLPLITAGALTVDVRGASVLNSPLADQSFGILQTITIAEAIGTDIVKGLHVANLVGRQAARTVFTVGSTAFTVDGVAQPPLDVAPVIQDGRTMMPIRAAANAAGVTNENIFFDAGVITIIRGDRVVQFTLGSRVMVVNGVAMNMDVAPALIANRALIPVRWVATALGVPVDWDGVAQTVTVTVN